MILRDVERTLAEVLQRRYRLAGDLKHMFFDSLVFTAEGLRHLVAECGSSRVVLGTDYPFPWTSTAVDHVVGTPGLSDADKAAILGGNLIDLLRIGPA